MNSLRGKSILVVDDDALMREVIGEIFEMHHVLVTEADSGVAALELVKTKKFDIVLSDVRMPGGDGITLAKNISEMPGYRPKVFICSGYNDLSAEQISAYNILKVIEKPFDHNSLILEIRRQLDHGDEIQAAGQKLAKAA